MKQLIESTAPGLGDSGLDTKKPADQLKALSADDQDVIRMLGLSEDEYRKANNLAA